MKIEIKCRLSGSVIFTHDAEENSIRLTVEAAVMVGANLAGANLAGANLVGAYLSGAYLVGANLAGANLVGANLTGANLAGANLTGANLVGAYLSGAYLAGANLVGDRPIFSIGPIGSRCAYLMAFLTDKGISVRAGCFSGSREEFAEQVERTHGDSNHGKEYRAALAMIDAHAELWTPKGDEQ